MGTVVRRALRLLWLPLRAAATRLRSIAGRSPDRPPPWQADIIDDIAFTRPWNIVIKMLRAQARLRSRWLTPGATIIIVNWNTLAVLQDTLHAVRALTPGSVYVMVVDNGSTDGSRQWLRSQEHVRTIALPANVGHAVALDIGTLLCRTDAAVTLDSDAVPLAIDWLAAVLEPLGRPQVVLAGLRSSRDFVHPVFSAIRVREFVDRNLSFQVWRLPGVLEQDSIWGVNSWDTAELMTSRLAPEEIVFVDRTPNPIDELPGMTAGGVVYHHGGVTRATESAEPESGKTSYAEWRRALEQLLPPEALSQPLSRP